MVKLQDLLTEVSELTRNSTTGSLDNSKRTRAFNWVCQDLQSFADWESTRRIKEFEFISGVQEYSLKNYIGATCLDNDGSTSIADFKNPLDLRLMDESYRPFEFRDAKDVRSHIKLSRELNEFGVDNDLLIINYAPSESLLIHACDSLTADGAWLASGDASNLTIDDIEYKQGDGSLNFDSAGTSLIITNASLTAVDLSDYENKSAWLIWVYIPTTTNFTSIALRWGSSASAYWEKTETARIDGQDLRAGWNRFAFVWKDATPTGSPDETAVDYLRIAITYSASLTDTDFRIDDIRLGKCKTMELEYYSLAFVKTSAGSYQKEFNADVTQSDELIGGDSLRDCFVEGANYRLFRIIGGKRERDETDSFTLYERARNQAKKKVGHKLRQPIRVLKFKR